MKKVILCMAFVVVFKFVSNISKYFRCKKLSSEHAVWVATGQGNFTRHKGQALDLFKGANISEGSIPISKPTGYGVISNYSLPLFMNLDSRRGDVASVVIGYFDEAIGTYFHRAFESLNPLYWIETIIFLPKRLLQYIGVEIDKPSVKLCNVLLTFLWWLFGAIFVFFRPQIENLIMSILR